MEIGSFALLALWMIGWACSGEPLPRVMRKAWPAWSRCGAGRVQACTSLPLPPSLVAFLSPASAATHALAQDAGVAPGWITLSIDPHASTCFALKTLAYSAIFFLVVVLANRRSRVSLLAEVLVYAALAHPVYAVLMHLWGAMPEYFGIRIRHGDSASGTYVNRNHFAGFLEMSLAIGIGLLIAGLSDRPRIPGRSSSGKRSSGSSARRWSCGSPCACW